MEIHWFLLQETWKTLFYYRIPLISVLWLALIRVASRLWTIENSNISLVFHAFLVFTNFLNSDVKIYRKPEKLHFTIEFHWFRCCDSSLWSASTALYFQNPLIFIGFTVFSRFWRFARWGVGGEVRSWILYFYVKINLCLIANYNLAAGRGLQGVVRGGFSPMDLEGGD